MAFGWREGVDAFGDGVPEVVYGSCGGFLEEGLELRERHLDGIEVGTIWRQEPQFGGGGFDGVTQGGGFVGGHRLVAWARHRPSAATDPPI